MHNFLGKIPNKLGNVCTWIHLIYRPLHTHIQPQPFYTQLGYLKTKILFLLDVHSTHHIWGNLGFVQPMMTILLSRSPALSAALSGLDCDGETVLTQMWVALYLYI